MLKTVLPRLEDFWPGLGKEISDSMHCVTRDACYVREPVNSAISAHGKRIRSLATLAAATLSPAVVRPLNPVCRMAAAVELVHEASLVHDDILDGSRIRRGRASVPAQFGVRQAFFSGAFLAGKGLSLIAQECLALGIEADLAPLQELAEAEIIESLPVPAETEGRRARLSEVADGKTGALFRFAMRLGAEVGRALGTQDLDPLALDPLARSLGRAFQVRDDILDITGDECLGHPGAGDLKRGLISWPLHFWVAAQDDPGAALKRIAQSARDRVGVDALRREILHSGAVESAKAELDAEIDRFAVKLNDLPPSIGRNVLTRIGRGLRLR